MASIKKREDGSWRARYRDANGRERARHFTKKTEAQAWLDSITTQLGTHTYVDPDRAKLTVGAWGEKYLAGRVDLKEKTQVGYESLWRTRIAPTWAKVPLTAVANADVAAWVSALHAEGLSPSRTRQAFHLLSGMLDAAVRDRRLAINPASGVKLPRMPRTERRYLGHEQLAAVADATGRYGTLVRVLGYCGLRYGEAAALRVGRVELMRRRFEIAEAMTTISGRAVFGTPKTHQTRSVPFPAFLYDELVALTAGLDADDFVFAAPRGGVLRENDFRRRFFDAACVAVGLGEMADGTRYVGFTPHELRHTAASLAIAAGESVKAVQTMLGHKTATMTLDLYGHLYGDELDAVADRIDAAARASAEVTRTRRGLEVVDLNVRRTRHSL